MSEGERPSPSRVVPPRVQHVRVSMPEAGFEPATATFGHRILNPTRLTSSATPARRRADHRKNAPTFQPTVGNREPRGEGPDRSVEESRRRRRSTWTLQATLQPPSSPRGVTTATEWHVEPDRVGPARRASHVGTSSCLSTRLRVPRALHRRLVPRGTRDCYVRDVRPSIRRYVVVQQVQHVLRLDVSFDCHGEDDRERARRSLSEPVGSRKWKMLKRFDARSSVVEWRHTENAPRWCDATGGAFGLSLPVVSPVCDMSRCFSAGGGTRTRTGREAHRILNPTRLPIPPLRRRSAQTRR